VGVHVKDTRVGELRGVPLGAGIVKFQQCFTLLASMGFSGPFVMEMWAHLDTGGDPVGSVTRARASLNQWISTAWQDISIT
jgi:L-ribulose-5-phosphate 3-epimerase